MAGPFSPVSTTPTMLGQTWWRKPMEKIFPSSTLLICVHHPPQVKMNPSRLLIRRMLVQRPSAPHSTAQSGSLRARRICSVLKLIRRTHPVLESSGVTMNVYWTRTCAVSAAGGGAAGGAEVVVVDLALAGPVDVLEDDSQDVSNGVSRQSLTIRLTKIGDTMDMRRLSRQKKRKHPGSPQSNLLDEEDSGRPVDVEGAEVSEVASNMLIHPNRPTRPRAHANRHHKSPHVLPQILGCGIDQSMHGPGMPPHTSSLKVLPSPDLVAAAFA